VREADAAGIKNVWMQQGAESDEAIQYCQEHGLNEVHGECIMSVALSTSIRRWPMRSTAICRSYILVRQCCHLTAMCRVMPTATRYDRPLQSANSVCR